MSDDPYLFNDLLQSSPASRLLGWNDVPYLLQGEALAHLGWFQKLDKRRINRTLKQMLEKSSEVLCIDRGPIPDLELWSFYEPESHNSYQVELLRSAVNKCTVLVVDLGVKPHATEPWKRRSTALYDFLAKSRVLEALDTNSSLREVVVLKIQDGLTSFVSWLGSLGARRVQHPVIYSFIDCNIVLSFKTASDKGTFHWGLPADLDLDLPALFEPYSFCMWGRAEASLPKFFLRSTQNPSLVPYGQDMTDDFLIDYFVSEASLNHQMAVVLKPVILPYPTSQLVWLRECREIMDNQFPDRHNWNISRQRLEKLVSQCVAGDYDHGTQNPPTGPYGQQDIINDFVKMAVLISVLGRKLSSGELDLPPPPEPVSGCSVHTKSTVCTCPSQTTGKYKAFSTCTVHSLEMCYLNSRFQNSSISSLRDCPPCLKTADRSLLDY